MNEFDIRTRTFGEGGLLPVRRVVNNDKTFTSPGKPSPVNRIVGNESVNPDSLEAVELYTQVDSALLRDARRNPDVSLVDRFGAQKVPKSVMKFAFTSFQDGHTISEQEADQIANAVSAVGDFATGPLQPDLADAVDPDEGLTDAAYQSYKTGARRVLEAYDTHPRDLPRMMILPKLGWTYLEDLLELYDEFDVETFCLNLDRRRITAGRQVGIMRPLARHFVERGIEEEVILYGINLDPRDKEMVAGVYPASNIAAFGMGIDLVGETHVPPKGPAEIFEPDEGEEDAEEVDEEPITFKLFIKEKWTFEDVPLDDLREKWPDDSHFPVDRALERARATPAALSRVQAIVNAEQMALAAQELRSELVDGDVIDFLESKTGVSENALDSFRDVRETFDDARSQSGLSDFN